MQATAHMAGQKVACPQCGGQFVVPQEFDPYYNWLGIPPSEQPANHYRLLGVQLFESNPGVIENAADRQMKHLQSFKIGAKAALSQRLLTEVAAARVQLLDPARRASYDQNLRASLTPATPVTQFPQLPEAGTAFAAPAASQSAVRRPGRRAENASLLSTIMIAVGGAAGLGVGVLLVFYLTGQDILGMSGKLKSPPAQVEVPIDRTTKVPQQPERPVEVRPIELPVNTVPAPTPSVPPPPRTRPSKPVIVAPPPVVVEPQPVPEPPAPPKPPDSIWLLNEAPRFLRLPALGSSVPETWLNFSRDPNEPPKFVLHTEAATLPNNSTLRVQAEPGDASWLIELQTDGQKVPVGQIRREGPGVVFAWSVPPADIEVRRQLANCMLEMTIEKEFRTLQLREPMVVSPLTIDFNDDKQPIELNILDTPASGKLFVRAQLENFQHGGKIRGDNEITPFTRPIFIDFTDFKGPEVDVRFVRQSSGKFNVPIKPWFIEAANRRFDLTYPNVDRIARAQEKIRSEAQTIMNNAQSNLVSAQRTLESLQNNQPTEPEQVGAWRARVNAATVTIKQMSVVIANAKEKVDDAQGRLNAVPEIRGFLDQHRSARIKYQIFARVGSAELILIDGNN